MKVSKRSIVCIIILQTILFLLVGCRSNVIVKNEIDKEEIVLKVEGIEIEYIHYNYLLVQVERHIEDNENFIKNSENEDFLQKKMYEIQKKYGSRTIAFAILVLDYAMYAEALRLGITVSEQEVQESMDRIKQYFSERKFVFPQYEKDFIKSIGEEYYWETFVPKVSERNWYIHKLKAKISQEDDVKSVQLSLVRKSNIKIINSELFDGVSLVQAIEYLEEYFNLLR